MSNKREAYYDLDDVGKIGVASERSTEEIRQDAEEMSVIIQAYKFGKASVIKGSNSNSKKLNQPITKVKGSQRPSKKHASRKTPAASR